MVKRLTDEQVKDLIHRHGFVWDGTEDGASYYLTNEGLRTLLSLEVEASSKELMRLQVLINTPELQDFTKGVVLEAIHQRERWGSDHDIGKSPFDWFWLIGYTAQKAAEAAVRGDIEKALHHAITTAAVCANWHAALAGADTSMRPGIEPSDFNAEATLTSSDVEKEVKV